MLDEIEIYEFSRAFDDIKYSDYHKRWVAGGSLPGKITRSNKDVPSIIREQVSKDYFALNDNYPPEPGEVALIAREIRDKAEHDRDIYYSILAVANRQIDDGDRLTIGYRYFWIATDDKEIDGILTLLQWWNKDKPEFNMEDAKSELHLPFAKTRPMYFRFYSKTDWFQPRIALPASQAEYIPCLGVISHQDKEQENEKFYLHVLRLHYFSYALSRLVNRPISWAWNVKSLKNPETFICLYCATEENKSAILPYRRKISELHNSQENHVKATETEGKSNEPPPINKTRRCLTDIARNFARRKELDCQEIQVFFEYLKQYSNEDWGQFIDKTTQKNSPNNTKITYEALLALVIPERTYPWLSGVIDSIPLPRYFKFIQNWFIQNWSQEIGILFQREIWYASSNYPDARSSLMRTVHQGISALLIQEIIERNVQEDYKQRLKKISFLLTESEWSGIFKDYTDSVWQELYSLEPKLTSDFSQRLHNALKDGKGLNSKQYSHIAKLCKLIGQENLSALLYLLCGEYSQEQFSDDVRNAVGLIYARHNSTATSTNKSLPESFSSLLSNDAYAYSVRGNARYELGDKLLAIDDYNQALKIDPNFALAYYNRGNARYELGDKLLAIEDYNHALKIDPNFALAYNNRAAARRDLGDKQGAIDDYNQALKIDPNFVLAYNGRGNARYELGDKLLAIDDYNQALKIDPNFAYAYNSRGNARRDLGDKQGAIDDYNYALKINPNFAHAYNNRGVARYELGDKQGAIDDYNYALKIDPNFALAYNNRGLARRDVGDKLLAIDDFQKAAKTGV